MLIANRNGMVVREPLPYDAEVQYLQSTGTQYIDTGIYCLKKYSFEFEVSVSYDGVSYEDYFGGSPSDSQAGWRFRRDGNSEKVLFSIGNAYTTSGVAMSKNTPHLIAMDGSGTATIDGTSVTLSGTSFLFDSSVSLYLFAYSKNNTPYRISNAKFYSFKCTDTDTGMVVMDMIPVRKNGVGYMYDRVSGTLFGNDGTGAFLYGQDVTPAFGYVQNGLIAMWDGIENAGWGVHDAAATTWKDLIGSVDLMVNSNTTWFNDALGSASRLVDGVAYSSSYISSIGTIEACFDLSSESDNGSGRGLVCNTNSRAIMGNSLLGIRSRGEAGVMMQESAGQLITAFNTSVVYGQTSSVDLIYFNGAAQQTVSSSGNWSLLNRIRIGGNGSLTNTAIIGKCHCVRIYSRALTADEIAANYAIDKARFNLP